MTKLSLQEEACFQAHPLPLGDMKLTGELCNLQVLEEAMMHDCVVSLLKARNEESLDRLCKLLPGFGKHLDPEETKVREREAGDGEDSCIHKNSIFISSPASDGSIF